MDTVALVKNEGTVRQTIETGLNLLGGFGGLQSPVLLKPNICTIDNSTGHTVTNIEVVKAVVDILLEQREDLEIRIVESDSQSKYADEAFEKFGYNQLTQNIQEKGYDVSTVNLSHSLKRSVDFDGFHFKNPEFPNTIIDHRFFISIATAKTHSLTWITGALKNQFGLLPEKQQSMFHSDIDEIIVDLNRLVQPNLCIVDARVGLESWNGPKQRVLDSFILGYSPVSVDATMARIMGFDPQEIKHLAKCAEHDLGDVNPRVLGEDIDSLMVQFKAP
ncbi:MAG: DUF362 domain-containing protein [Candidatus Thorarchaeota archaeon]|nr:DUF362 domain-containing protein [Candidatus Thorarchaeota archaeon]